MPTKTTLIPMEPQPELRYPGVGKIVLGKHPFSPSGFKGTPAEGRVDGEDRNAWLVEDWCGNLVGAIEIEDFPTCPHPPGSKLPDGSVVTSCEVVQWRDVTEAMAEQTGCDWNALTYRICKWLELAQLTPTTYLWLVRSEAIGDSDAD